ncbi:metastasis-associated protein MTA3-like [Corticium candelabrum]|uniref:metastasis-associated protein MTA3-like n=1 Tax=Corticium candelabrum TaxID=121492 RepID=UPI002E269FC8|nr:metastasis-associated protein MTA3-like [Corticium candelabrum]
MAEGSYHLGDFVYMEVDPAPAPYRICRLEELSKTPEGRIEALVTCMFRRRDLPPSLAQMADKFAADFEESDDCLWSTSHLDTVLKHQLRHREVFLCRDYETYEISLIRGKCSVTLLCEVETPDLYLKRPDAFYYSLVYDPQVKTLQADKNNIRVGDKFQAFVPDATSPSEVREPEAMASQMWNPVGMSHKEIDQFMVLARSVGTFARAMITSKSFQPTLHASAAAASRDTTLLHAMTVLHRSNYDLGSAVGYLVPQGGPLLCRDEMENWTAEEANMFESALQLCGKDFFDIQRDHLNWKSIKSIVEYYYMWKTSDRYTYTKQQKLLERQNKLRDFAIKKAPGHPDNTGGRGGGSTGGNSHGSSNASPHLSSSSVPGDGSHGGMSGQGGVSGESGRQQSGGGSNHSGGKMALIQGNRPCECCQAMFSTAWKNWGPGEHRLKLCIDCWDYWRKYAGLKFITKWENVRQSKISSLENYTCPRCNKFFSRKERLATHLREQCFHPLPAGRINRVNHSIYRLFFMRPKSSVFIARKLLGASELRRCAIEPRNLVNVPMLKSKSFPPKWIPVCRRIRQVVEPASGDFDMRTIYSVATVFQDVSESGDGMGHSRRPIQKLLDSPTLAARDARKQKIRTPTSTEPPPLGQSREKAMADAMLKMHQDKLKKSVNNHSPVTTTPGQSLVREMEQRGRGLKRPAINITKAEIIQSPVKKLKVTAGTPSLLSQSRMQDQPYQQVTISNSKVFPAGRKKSVVEIDLLKPTAAQQQSAVAANRSKNVRGPDNGYHYRTPGGELFFFKVPLMQKQNRESLRNRGKLRILARAPCSRIATMKLSQNGTMMNGSPQRAAKQQLSKRNPPVMEDVIDKMKLDMQPRRSAGDLIAVN